MRIIAFDQARKSGWAYRSISSNQIVYGTFDIGEHKKRCNRFVMFYNRVGELLDRHGPFDVVSYEIPFVRNGAGAVSGYGYVALLELLAGQRDKVLWSTNPMALKKFICGTGKATGRDVMLAARRYVTKVDDEDEGAAIALLIMTENRINA